MPPQERGAATPAFTIRVNGTDLPAEARGEVARIVVEEGLDCVGTFAIQFNNLKEKSQEPKWSEAALFDPGAAVQIQFGYTEAVTTIMAGEITGLEIAFTPDAGALFIVRGHDRLHHF